MEHRIPVILDTDPGSDIDDSWAIAMLLRSPECDLRLIAAATGEPSLRAMVVSRLLAAAGRSGIPVSAGRRYQTKEMAFHLGAYLKHTGDLPGHYPDAAESIVRTVRESPEPVTLIAIAPLTNIADALRLEPEIASRIDFVGMFGSLFRQYDGSKGRCAEWNLWCDQESADLVFNRTRWRSMTITPLDTCGEIVFSRAALLPLEQSKDPLIAELMTSYRWWLASVEKKRIDQVNLPPRTSSLFDTVAVYLALSRRELLEMRKLRLSFENAILRENENAPNEINVALEWKEKSAFLELLAGRLLGTRSPN